jgi:hypothetical protein
VPSAGIVCVELLLGTDSGLFLQEAYRYFGGATAELSAKGIGVFHLLREALSHQAGHVLGQALVQQGKIDAARKALHDVLTLRKRIGDPRTWQTEKLLNGLADTAGPGAEESP